MSSANKLIKDHPAFPVTPHPGDHANKAVRGNSGMSMLDFFIAAATIGLASTDMSGRQIAEEACDIAEEIMLERQSRNNLK
jgi:hypothetical protein